ncbi:MAG TPA: PASTA domain-containing protein [Rubrobacteraceae bacterium]|nr:PASTA domain-containing protein [Rubrobacteraceae bacterium]
MISGRGLIYTVEEVSEMLGIPRPTLYRYLREYSIPHVRKSGKISIPEESFDRIREARDLHKEGLGTESVRRALREGSNGPDTGEIKAQIDQLSERLERLRGNGSAADEALSSQAMRTVLARQSLLMSAMFNLTEMMEELLLASGKPRKTVFEEVGGEIREVPIPRRRGRLRTRRSVPAGAEPRALPRSSELPATRAERFGSLARRRRRTSLVIISLLLVCVALLALTRLEGEELFAGLPFVGDRTGESPSTPKEAPENEAEGGTATGSVAAARSPSEGNTTSGTGASGGMMKTGPGEVPDVSGRDVEEAARRLSRAGYEVAAIQVVKSDEEAGTVLRTQPAAGTAAEPGSPVFLIMSSGPTGRSG